MLVDRREGLTYLTLVQRESTRLSIILAAGSLISMAGGAIAPVSPQIITALEFDRALAGNLVSIHALTIALSSPILGLIADKISPVRVLVPSLVCYGIFGTAGALVTNFWVLLVTRALLGITAGGIAAGGMGLLAKLYDKQARAQAIAYATATLTITGIIFPLLAGALGSIHWRYAFVTYAIAFPLAMLVVLAFPEFREQGKQPAKGISSELKAIIFNSKVVQLLLLVAITAAIMYSVVIYAPLYIKETLGLGSFENGILLATRPLGAALISTFGSKYLIKTFSSNYAIALGFGLMGLTLFSIPVIPNFPLLLISALLFGIGFGLVLPNLYSQLSNLSPSTVRSSVLAVAIGTSFLGQFLSPILFGPILETMGLTAVFNTASLIAILAGFFLLYQVPR